MTPSPTPSPNVQSGRPKIVPTVKDDPKLWVRSPYPDVKPVLGKECHELLLERFLEYGDIPAMTCAVTGKCLTYAQLYQQARSFGAALIKDGYKKGDIVAILLPNCIEYPVAVLGSWCAGMAIVGLNPRYTESETLRQFQVCDARVVITEPSFLDIVSRAQAENSDLKTVVLVGNETVNGHTSFAELIQTEVEDVQLSSGEGTDTTNSVAFLPFSSGTTGTPKLAILSHAQVANFPFQFLQEDVMSLKSYDPVTGDRERLLALMPFFHGYGFLMFMVLGTYQGAHSMILPKFEPQIFLDVIRKHKPTTLHLVTPLITHIVNSDDFTRKELESVHTIFAGGAPIGVGIINRCLEKAGRYIFFMEGYGMTETLVVHLLNPSTRNTKIGSCGRVVPNVVVKLVDVVTGETVGPNRPGEILVKPGLPSKGYFRNEQATQQLIDKEGWVHTGDVAYYDEERYFYVVDRIKELIKVKAFQVAPGELEDLLRKHPEVSDCAVIGIPSEEHGEVPRAYVVPKSNSLTENDIHAFLNPLLATYKQLKGGVEFVESIAKTPSGKILRRELREHFARSGSPQLGKLGS